MPLVLAVCTVLLLVTGYATVALATADRWSGTPARPGTQLTFAATTSTGSTPTEAHLAETATRLGRRITGIGVAHSDVRIDGTTLSVTVPDSGVNATRGLISAGRLDIRPVVNSYPVTNKPDPVPTPDPAPGRTGRTGNTGRTGRTENTAARAELIRQYKLLRQSTNSPTLYVATQPTAQLCGHDDPLAGNDDPTLPLVTCSADAKTVYLLKPSIIGGDDITDAAYGYDGDTGEWVVNLTFNDRAADTWAQFTRDNPGTRTAFTLGTAVLTAPAIREAITGGATQISGSFTEDSAKGLTNTLRAGVLPLTLSEQSARPGTLPGRPAFTPLRYALVGAGVLIELFGIGVLAMIMRRRPWTGA